MSDTEERQISPVEADGDHDAGLEDDVADAAGVRLAASACSAVLVAFVAAGAEGVAG